MTDDTPANTPDDIAALTLEELTTRTGTSVRTVRFYTARGLLPPPERRGRSGYYSAEHVARLELVQELQAHGFTLAAIERYVSGIPDSASAADIALRATLLAPWTSDRPTSMDRTELESRADRTLSDDDVAVLEALGVVRPDGARYDVAVSHLSAGLALLDVGFPPDAARAAAEVYARHGREVAEELYAVFRRLAWPAFRRAGTTPEDISAVVERLKPMSAASLVAAYEQGMDDTRRHEIAKRAPERPAASGDG